MTQLQILVTLGPEPHPIEIGKYEMKLRFSANWLVDGVPQPCEGKDLALVINTLKQTTDTAMMQAPFDPPKILQGIAPPPGVQ